MVALILPSRGKDNLRFYEVRYQDLIGLPNLEAHLTCSTPPRHGHLVFLLALLFIFVLGQAHTCRCKW